MVSVDVDFGVEVVDVDWDKAGRDCHVMVSVDVDFGVEVVDVDWDKAGQDCLRDCYSNHLRLRKHRYLD
jgi:ribosome maturation factor RimP